jgi:dolichol-phosphate mannosyltransferase
MVNSLTVIMPAYNEEAGIEAAVQEVSNEILDRVANANLIVVNDGSKDNTAIILDRLAAADDRIRVIHKPNSGHGPSLVRGLNESTSEFVFLIDSDMQIPLSCFPQLWQHIDSADGVFGIRANRQDPKARLILSRIIAIVLSLMFSVSLSDSNVPCKLFRLKIWNELYALLQDPNIMTPSILIAIYAKKHQFKIVNVPVPHRARATGEPSLRLRSLIRFCSKGFMQVVKYKRSL